MRELFVNLADALPEQKQPARKQDDIPPSHPVDLRKMFGGGTMLVERPESIEHDLGNSQRGQVEDRSLIQFIDDVRQRRQ